ncbi:S8 family serine peptidase [Catellatospora sp. NPDC049609]|uniref:S8 family serine peptidase n=1 Tax=Catellatospora sp. NPDC049609 TaxID=3155505 RepID=UPI00343BCCCE
MSALKLGRLSTALLTTVALLAAAPAASAAPEPEPGPPGRLKGPGSAKRDKLGSHDRELLVKAVRDGKKKVTTMLAVAPGEFDAARKAVEAAGGTVAAAQPKVGYLRAGIPTGAVDAVAQQTSVLAVDLDEEIRLADPVPAPEGRRKGGTAKAPGPKTPAANPYLPTHETGAVGFVAEHPAWDGRGVTIGILDSGVDLDHPALATTTTGERKIVDWVTATDPLTEGDGTWVELTDTVTASPAFTVGWREGYTAPASGEFRFGTFYEYATVGPNDVNGDVNRNGTPWDAFDVLLRPSDRAIWVDTDADRDFSDETLLRPYREQQVAGRFGTDDPDTAVNESMPFTVEHRLGVDLAPAGREGTADFVNIGLVESAHGTHVAGIAAGRGLFGGKMNGAAPGAKIVSSRACTWSGGCTAVALTEGMIDLVVNRGVDVVNMSIGGLPALNDGANVRTHLYNTLIAEYGVQLFLSAGNSGPGLNTIGDPAVASDAIAVGASVSADTWAADYGSEVKTRMGIFAFSSRGPREDGGFKPDLVAPGAAVSTTPTWLPGAPVPGVGYQLPPGYSMFNGTSMASPQAAGGAALLLSAAKATGVDAAPAKLRAAVSGSARFLSGVAAHEQGNGLLDVAAAWRALAKGGLATSTYTIDAPVCTPISAYLPTPHRGAGLYHRCPGAPSPRQEVVVTRTSGPATAELHRISWRGDGGTFRTAQDTVRLPLNEPVRVPVWVRADGNGVHSAIMELDDPATPGVDARMMATVATADELAAPSYTRTHSGRVDRAQAESYLVTVPEDAGVLQVKLDGVDAGDRVRFTAQHPYGVPAEQGCYTNLDEGCNPHVRSFRDPAPGVWEITVEASRTSPSERNDYRLTVQAFGATAAGEARLGTLELHQPVPVEWQVTNHLGAVSLGASTSPLSSRFAERATVAHHEQKLFTVVVPYGAGRFSARIGNPADPAADLDLIVAVGGVVIGQSADGDSDESVVIDNPPPGYYAVWVDGYSVPSGSTAFDYSDELASSSLGTVATTFTAPLALARGATKPVTAQVTAAGNAPEGRTLYGGLDLVNTDGATVGRAGVTIEGVRAPSVRVDTMFGPMAVYAAQDGVAVGSAQINATVTPARWTPEGGLVGYTGHTGSIFDVNRHGVAVGQSEHIETPTLPGVFHPDGTITELPIPEWIPDADYGRAFALNDAGAIVGNISAYREDAAYRWHNEPYLWTEQGGYVRLPQLSADPESTEPIAINNNGLIVGGAGDGTGLAVAVRWDAATGQIQRIGSVVDGEPSVLLDVNDAGTAVGESGSRAAIWTADGGIRRLPDFGFHSKAVGINASGWVIGEADIMPYDTHVVAWDPQGRLWDLTAMAGSDKFYLAEAADVTDDGGFIAYGYPMDGTENATHAIVRF